MLYFLSGIVYNESRGDVNWISKRSYLMLNFSTENTAFLIYPMNEKWNSSGAFNPEILIQYENYLSRLIVKILEFSAMMGYLI